ncbi:MAG: Uma2 family endonuclease [Planctomycetota bacterium]
MITTASPLQPIQPPHGALPPLQNGDRLSRAEFERRYEGMPGVKKAELIDGVVYMPSPVKHAQHGRPHLIVSTWLGVYMSLVPTVDGGDNSTLRLDLDNEPQPDGFLRLLPENGGQTMIDADGYLVGGPELIVEVAATSASYDLNQKLHVYRRHNVKEYIVWRVLDRTVDWFVLRDDLYERLPMTEGVYRSPLFPGLWLDPEALVGDDIGRVLAALWQGMKRTPPQPAEGMS